ncbi:MAG TPA: efflux RND transporter periplasmic adaptor subunit [Edaphobacter sp.]|nr:efflux RND transporter periplasmic adaptor subunit [Edaphobacter sp.]
MRKRTSTALAAVVMLASLAVFSAIGCKGNSRVEADTGRKSYPIAPIAIAKRTALANTLNVAGEFIPFQEVELHAKVAGYIRHIYVDIGDKVKEGQVLATLDIPELTAQVEGANAGVRQTQEQITRAQSEVQRAEANYMAIHSAAQRLQHASDARPGLIAEQELDDAQAKDRAAAAEVDAAKSALSAMKQQLGVSRAAQLHYTSLADYSRITAPFSGVITWRYADTGSLIQAGTSNASSMPVVKLAQVNVLRLRIPVPESLAGFVRDGDQATVHVQATGEKFTGTVTRSTAALDTATRTMQVEIDVPNKNGKLTPGMYADVSLDIKRAGNALAVPVQAVDQSGSHPFVLVVDKNDRIEKRNVQTGIATPNQIGILGGLSEGDRVVVANLDSFQPGELVSPQVSKMVVDGSSGGSQ